MPEGKYFTIESLLNGMVLDIEGGAMEDGTKVIMFPPHENDNQLWWEDHHRGVIRSKVDENFCLTVEGRFWALELFL